jgi:hydroxyethylthiazole kinase-like uncharacterized protein yjeF
MLVVSAAEMRELDRLTIQEYGVPSLTLMERAGEAVAQAILENFGTSGKKGVVVIAGKGNNGGDGLVVARVLKKKRVPCAVALLAREEELSPDAAHNLRAYRAVRGRVIEIGPPKFALLTEQVSHAGLIVDAVLGTGLKNSVRGLYADAIALINAAGLPVVAVDTPSGLDADAGVPLGIAVQAELTVALGFPKLGEIIFPGVGYTGDLAVADIGIDQRAVERVAPRTELLEDAEIRWLVPRRDPDSHKGDYGHVLIIAGSRGKTGAAILACRAAMRSGAGLVTLAAARSLNDIFAGALVEVMTEPLPENPADVIEAPSVEDWQRMLQRKDALLFGPGIGVSEGSQNMMRWMLRHIDIPWVIDADGLNNLVLEIERLRGAKVPPVLTPHPGEMARLIGRSAAEVNADRIGIARSFAEAHRCYLILKGARSVIATPAGKIFVNPTGNPGMASGGMGDVLAGMIAAFLGQGLSAEDAMKLGVYLHGYAGDNIARERGQAGLIASDIIEGLPSGLRDLARQSAPPPVVA